MKLLARIVLHLLFPPSEALARIQAAIRDDIFPTPTIFDRGGISIIHTYKNQLIHDIIIESKTTGNTECITTMAHIFSEIILDMSADIDTGTMSDIIITSVPTHPIKVRNRGFNHLHDILKSIKKEKRMIEFNVCVKALRAVRTTSDQVGKTKTERVENLKGAFEAHETLVKGKTIFVIDDVTTTGATFGEARRALVRAGARKVVPIAFAG
jgi:ComF family protein